MSSSKIIATLSLFVTLLGVAAIIAFLLLFPKQEADIKQPEAPLQETPPAPTEIIPSPDELSTIPHNAPLAESSWEWTQTTMRDDTITKPEKPGVFVLTFLNDSQFGVTTDCNRAGGSYTATENALAFLKIYSTKMACPGKTQEENFLKQLEEVQTFHRDGDSLVLELKTDSGTMTFVPYDQEEKKKSKTSE